MWSFHKLLWKARKACPHATFTLFFFFYTHTYKLWILWICSCKLCAMMLLHIRTNTVRYLLFIALVHAAINSVRLRNLVPPKMTLERERERVDNFIPKLQLLHGTDICLGRQSRVKCPNLYTPPYWFSYSKQYDNHCMNSLFLPSCLFYCHIYH